MRQRHQKLLAITLFTIAAFAIPAQQTEAGGYGNQCYSGYGAPGYSARPYYGNSFYGNTVYRNPFCLPSLRLPSFRLPRLQPMFSFRAPFHCQPQMNCRPNPCCSPCGTAPCGTGNPCQVQSVPKTPTPISEDKGTPTFRGDKKNGEPNNDSKFTKPEKGNEYDPSTQPKKKPKPLDSFKEPAKEKEEEKPFPTFDDEKQERFKFPTKEKTEEKDVPKKTLIPGKKPAPAKPAIGDSDKSNTTIQPLQLDEKITWQNRSQRTRLVIRQQANSTTIARTKAVPTNQHWQIAKK